MRPEEASKSQTKLGSECRRVSCSVENLQCISHVESHPANVWDRAWLGGRCECSSSSLPISARMLGLETLFKLVGYCSDGSKDDRCDVQT